MFHVETKIDGKWCKTKGSHASIDTAAKLVRYIAAGGFEAQVVNTKWGIVECGLKPISRGGLKIYT